MSKVELSTATGEWGVKTYSQRNWVEVFSQEAKGWLGLKAGGVTKIVKK
jgi:hypothetical protein